MKDNPNESYTVTLAHSQITWLTELLEYQLAEPDDEYDYYHARDIRDRLYAVLG